MVLASSLSWTLTLLSARTAESQNLLFADVDQVTVPSWAVCGSLCEKDELCRYLKLRLILTIPAHFSFHSFLLPNILPWNNTFCWLWDKPTTGIGALTDITEGWFASFFFFFFLADFVKSEIKFRSKEREDELLSLLRSSLTDWGLLFYNSGQVNFA